MGTGWLRGVGRRGSESIVTGPTCASSTCAVPESTGARALHPAVASERRSVAVTGMPATSASSAATCAFDMLWSPLPRVEAQRISAPTDTLGMLMPSSVHGAGGRNSGASK